MIQYIFYSLLICLHAVSLSSYAEGNAEISIIASKPGIIITDLDTIPSAIEYPGYTTPHNYEGYNAFWNDEFNGNEINLEDWIIADKGHWYNNELQYYNPKNTAVDNGLLTITAKKETFKNHSYTSSRLWTKHNVYFKYGRIDIRAKLPFSQGMWPALWMLGENRDEAGWPACGEIDIMEMRGHTPNTVSSTIHFKNSAGKHQYPPSKKYTLPNGDFSDEFHVFSMIWDESKMEFYVDDQLFNTIYHSRQTYYDQKNPFIKEFYLLMNLAVGGDFGGNPDDTTIWPQTMQVDYVRIFTKNNVNYQTVQDK